MSRRFRDAAAVITDLGAYLSRTRHARNLTQEDVAAATGLWTSQVSYVERIPDYGLGRRATVALLLWLDEVNGEETADQQP